MPASLHLCVWVLAQANRYWLWINVPEMLKHPCLTLSSKRDWVFAFLQSPFSCLPAGGAAFPPPSPSLALWNWEVCVCGLHLGSYLSIAGQLGRKPFSLVVVATWHECLREVTDILQLLLVVWGSASSPSLGLSSQIQALLFRQVSPNPAKLPWNSPSAIWHRPGVRFLL